MPTLLTYDLISEPALLQASAASGELSLARLTLIATNQGTGSLALDDIMVTLPLGDSGAELTPSAQIGHVAVTAPTGMRLDDVKARPDFLFIPDDDDTLTVAGGGSLVFVFDKLAINRVPGTVSITISETAKPIDDDRAPDNNADDRTVNWNLTKLPHGWSDVNFWATHAGEAAAVIDYGETVALHWSGPTGATYTIDYLAGDQPVHVPATGDPVLANQGEYPGVDRPPLKLLASTTFSLNVVFGDHQAQSQVSVAVRPPRPTINRFTIVANPAGAGQPRSFTLSWDLSFVTHFQISANDGPGGQAVVLPVPEGATSFLVTPRQRETRYTLTILEPAPV